MAPDVVSALMDAFAQAELDLAVVGRAWARATPLVALVPAFGLRVLPTPVRATLGLSFAAVIYPTVAASAAETTTAAMDATATTLLLEFLRGVPVAVATATPLWAMTMAGGLADQLRGAQETLSFPTVEGRTSPLGILFSLAAASLFLASGGPARALLLLTAPLEPSIVLSVTRTLVQGSALAISVAAPMLCAALVLEVGAALIARAASPAHIDAIVGPLKSLALLAIAALALDRMFVLF